MVIAIVILGIFLFIALCAIGFLFMILKACSKYIKLDDKTATNIFFDKKNIVKEYPCNLLLTLTINENLSDVLAAYDFSEYEERKIIGLTIYYGDDSRIKQMFKGDEEEISLMYYNQKVYEMKDGGYQWDFRSLSQ
jgi:hypothetical protein